MTAKHTVCYIKGIQSQTRLVQANANAKVLHQGPPAGANYVTATELMLWLMIFPLSCFFFFLIIFYFIFLSRYEFEEHRIKTVYVHSRHTAPPVFSLSGSRLVLPAPLSRHLSFLSTL